MILRILLILLSLVALGSALRLLSGREETKEQGLTDRLLDAIEANDIAAVRESLASGAEVNFPGMETDNENGVRLFYPLIHAAVRNQHATVRLLLESGADAAVRREDEATALLAACCTADAEMVQLLLQAGSQVNTTDDAGHTPLIMAAIMGESAEVVQLLLRAGAEVNRTDASGCTALHYAALPEAGNEETDLSIMRILLENGATPNVQDAEGETPLLQCARDGVTEGVRLLLEYKADPALRNHEGKSPLDYARENGHTEVIEFLKN